MGREPTVRGGGTGVSIQSRADAQRRADEIRTFRRELELLESEGVVALADVQRSAIADHHAGLLAGFARDFDIDRDTRSKQMSLGMRIASLIGALAMAASVFFLFYQFWGWFTTTSQVAILACAAAGSFVAALWVQGRDPSGYFAKLAAMVAFACFVLNIAMLGSIFNITPSDKALLVWAALASLLAYAFDLRLLLGAAIVCLVGFIAARMGTVSGMYWLYFGQRPENFLPAAILLLAFPSLVRHARYPDFPAVYRVFGLLALFLPIVVLSNWGRLSYLQIDPDVVEVVYQVVGFGGSAAAIWVGVRNHWPHVVNTAVTLFLVLLYTKFFDWWWEAMPKYLFFLVLGLSAVLFLVVLRRMRTAITSGPPA